MWPNFIPRRKSFLSQWGMGKVASGGNVFVGYLVKLMGNNRVIKYLQANFPEILEEFGKIVGQTSIEA